VSRWGFTALGLGRDYSQRRGCDPMKVLEEMRESSS